MDDDPIEARVDQRTNDENGKDIRSERTKMANKGDDQTTAAISRYRPYWVMGLDQQGQLCGRVSTINEARDHSGPAVMVKMAQMARSRP